MAEQPDMRALRPDILGSVSVGHEDGKWTMVIYFTSEAEAREGEAKEMPPEALQGHGGDAVAVGRPARVPRPQDAVAGLAQVALRGGR